MRVSSTSSTKVSNAETPRLLALYGQGDDRPIVYEENGVAVYRASAVGECLRALVAARMEYQPAKDPEYLTRAAAEGNLHEPDIQQKVRDMGLELIEAQDQVEVPIIKDRVVIRGHVDGIVTGDMLGKLVPNLRKGSPLPKETDMKAVLEAKTMSRRVFDEWERGRFGAKVRYAYQVSCYMKAQGDVPAIYAVKRRDDGFMEYTWIDKPPIPWERIKWRVLESERWARRFQLPPCDVDRQWGCAYWFLHEEEDPGAVDDLPIDEEMLMILEDLAPVYRDAKDREKVAKDEANEMKDRIRELMMGKSRVDLKDFIITWVTQQRMSFDYKLLLEEIKQGLEIDRTLERYQRPYTVEYPLVKERDTP